MRSREVGKKKRMKYNDFFAESAAVLTLEEKKWRVLCSNGFRGSAPLKQNLWTSHAQNESDEQEEPYDCVG